MQASKSRMEDTADGHVPGKASQGLGGAPVAPAGSSRLPPEFHGAATAPKISGLRFLAQRPRRDSQARAGWRSHRAEILSPAPGGAVIAPKFSGLRRLAQSPRQTPP